MAEEQEEIMIEDDAIALDDSEDTNISAIFSAKFPNHSAVPDTSSSIDIAFVCLKVLS